MLYETLLQAKIFLSIFYFGIISGLFYEFFHLIKSKIYIINFVVDFLSMLVFGAVFITSVHIFCYGEFRFYTILAFLVGFFVERKSIGKFLALFLNMFYNISVKFFNKLKTFKIIKYLVKIFKQIFNKLNFVKKLKLKKVKQEVNNEGLC